VRRDERETDPPYQNEANGRQAGLTDSPAIERAVLLRRGLGCDGEQVRAERAEPRLALNGTWGPEDALSDRSVVPERVKVSEEPAGALDSVHVVDFEPDGRKLISSFVRSNSKTPSSSVSRFASTFVW
jgi:hypothetical protein